VEAGGISQKMVLSKIRTVLLSLWVLVAAKAITNNHGDEGAFEMLAE
jgi:hypothetical protein